MQMILSSLLTCLRNVSCGTFYGKKHGGGGGVEDKCREDNFNDLWYRPGPLAEFR